MIMYDYLINALVFGGIILLLALSVAVVQLILILTDVRHTTKEIRKKLIAITSVLDIVGLLMGGIKGAQGRIKKKMSPDSSTVIAVTSGLKKGLQILLKGKKKKGKKKETKEENEDG
jgi:hypothetical protein